MANPPLPALVLKTVFDFVSIPEKLRMRLVCKTWRFVVDNLYSQQNLCLYFTSFPYNRRWPFSEQPVLEEEMLYRKFNPEQDPKPDPNFHLKLPFFRDLRKLFIYRVGPQIDVFLAEVGQLASLKELKIDNYHMKTRKLSSSSLERLSLYVSNFEHLEFETPNLNSICDLSLRSRSFRGRENARTLEFRFPLTVKRLVCWKFDENYSQLQNLETLTCLKFPLNFQMNKFKSLIKLEILPSNERELQILRDLQKERTRLGRDHPQMIVSDFKEQLVICENFGGILELSSAYLQQVLENSSNLVARIPRKSNIDASTLLEWAHLIPNFFERFQIDCISLRREGRLTDADQCDLVELIRRSRPRCLSIYDLNGLKSEFYQKISLCESIKILNMKPPAEPIDYNQLLNLRNLEVLRLHYHNSTEKIPLDFISKLFVQLKFLCEFDFNSNWGKSLDWGSRITISYEPLPLSIEDPESYAHKLAFPYDLSFGEEPLFLTDLDYCRDLDELVHKIHRMVDHKVIRNCLIF